MYFMKKLLAILLALSMVLSFAACGKDDSEDRDSRKKKDETVVENTEEETFYKYIKGNLSHSTSTWLYPANPETGVFSALIKDFDGDDTDEMVTFSLVKDSYDYWSVVLDSYVVEDGKVIYGSQSEGLSLTGGGNYQLEVCAVTDGNKIRIMKTAFNGGGSSYVSQCLSYEIQDGALIKSDEYFMSEYYRYETYQYEEKVSGTVYASVEEFNEAVEDAGYDTSLHNHIAGDNPEYDIHGDVDVYDAECFGGDHIFSLLDSVNLLGEERLGYLHDNTGFSAQMAEIKADEEDDENDLNNKEEDTESDPTVELTDEDYKILCDIVNYSVINFDCNSDTAVKDAYYIIMDRLGPYDLFFTDDPYVYTKDPRGEFPFDYHYKYPEIGVDWILKNVYNITPDHNLSVSNGDFVYMYYQDGYYYMCPLEKGFVRDYPVVIETKVNDDGKYEIRMSGDLMDEVYEYIDVVAEPKYVDGKNIWSIYKITVTKA